MKLTQWIVNFLKDEEGATVVEYAVMLVLIVLVAIATIIVVGEKVENGFNRIAEKLPTS